MAEGGCQVRPLLPSTGPSAWGLPWLVPSTPLSKGFALSDIQSNSNYGNQLNSPLLLGGHQEQGLPCEMLPDPKFPGSSYVCDIHKAVPVPLALSSPCMTPGISDNCWCQEMRMLLPSCSPSAVRAGQESRPLLGVCCQQDSDRRQTRPKTDQLRHGECLCNLLGSICSLGPVMVLHAGVKIILADQEAVANGAGRGRDLAPKGEMKNIPIAACCSKIPGQLKSLESNSQDIPSN